MGDTWQSLLKAAWLEFWEIDGVEDGSNFRQILVRTLRSRSPHNIDPAYHPMEGILGHAWGQVRVSFTLRCCILPEAEGLDLSTVRHWSPSHPKLRTGKGSCSLRRFGHSKLAKSIASKMRSVNVRISPYGSLDGFMRVWSGLTGLAVYRDPATFPKLPARAPAFRAQKHIKDCHARAADDATPAAAAAAAVPKTPLRVSREPYAMRHRVPRTPPTSVAASPPAPVATAPALLAPATPALSANSRPLAAHEAAQRKRKRATPVLLKSLSPRNPTPSDCGACVGQCWSGLCTVSF